MAVVRGAIRIVHRVFVGCPLPVYAGCGKIYSFGDDDTNTYNNTNESIDGNLFAEGVFHFMYDIYKIRCRVRWRFVVKECVRA